MKLSNLSKLHNVAILATTINLVPVGANAAVLSLIEFNFNLNINVFGNPAKIDNTTHPNSPLDIVYNETDSDFSLSVISNGKFDPEVLKYKWKIQSGQLWKIDLNIDYTNALLEDESTLTITGTAFHNSKPRGIEHDKDNPTGEIFQINFPTFNLEEKLTDPGWKDNVITFNKPDTVNHRPTHKDDYETNKLTINRDPSEQEELSRFLYSLEGVHKEVHTKVPESSSTLSLLALGTLGAASTFKRQLKPSQSTEKETTKVG